MTDLTVRLAQAADAAAVAAIYRPVVRDTVISFEVGEIADEEMAARIDATVPARPWLVGERGGAVVGYAYAGAHNPRAAYAWSVDVSIFVAEGARGGGVARRLYTALFDLLAEQGFVNVFAGISLPNAASVGLHASLGFAPVGVERRVGWKFDAWWDVGWWQRRLVEIPAPRALVPVSEIPDLVPRLLDG